MGKGWAIFLLALAILYAAYSGYIPEGQKYLKQIEARIKGSLPEPKIQSTSNVGYSRLFPLKISYNTTKEGKIFVMTLKLENTGKDAIYLTLNGVAITDDTGQVYEGYGNTVFVQPLTWQHMKIYPGEIRAVKVYFKKVPSKGTLHIDLIKAVEFGKTESETINIPFSFLEKK